jgi:hypothetical protein
MNRRITLLALFVSTLAVSSVTIGTVLAQAKLTSQSKVSINGIGSIQVGMTVSQAAKAGGIRLIKSPGQDNSCYYVNPQGEPREVGFMVTGGNISRVDVRKNSRITTVSGAKIGDTEARIKSLYPGQIQVTPHKYTDGHYLTLIPKNSADKNYRVVFETDGQRVTQFRSGKLPEVEYVEGCS